MQKGEIVLIFGLFLSDQTPKIEQEAYDEGGNQECKQKLKGVDKPVDRTDMVPQPHSLRSDRGTKTGRSHFFDGFFHCLLPFLASEEEIP